MPVPAKTFVLVDPDPHARALVAWHLAPLGARILQASTGTEGLQLVASQPVAVIVTELYLPTGAEECLIHAIRRNPALKRSRVVAHTHRSMTADREWAMRAGADAYLVKPTRAQRLRYVVGRLLGNGKGSAGIGPPATSSAPMTRRDSLDAALGEIEQGGLPDTSTIVFGRTWWNALATQERQAFRARARKTGVSLRSDSMLGNHFVEVRGATRDGIGLSTEQPESPYRR